jgi:hypothetical protein
MNTSRHIDAHIYIYRVDLNKPPPEPGLGSKPVYICIYTCIQNYPYEYKQTHRCTHIYIYRVDKVDLNKPPLEPGLGPKPVSGKPPLVPGGLKRLNVNNKTSDNQKITPGAAVRAQIKRV